MTPLEDVSYRLVVCASTQAGHVCHLLHVQIADSDILSLIGGKSEGHLQLSVGTLLADNEIKLLVLVLSCV